MKVIMAGFSKTGTKSIHAALTELGYEVYDYLDHCLYHYDKWKTIAEGSGRVEDFREMYEDIDAVAGCPSYLYWYEIHQAFPEAKIILSVRDELSWLRSVDTNMMHINARSNSTFGTYRTKFIPMDRRWNAHAERFGAEAALIRKKGWIKSKWVVNKMFALQKFRRHNAYVMQVAPKEKLLVFNVKEGWEPLCKFLGKKIPDIPFPHVNIGGTNQKTQMQEHEFGRIARKQLILSLVVFVLIGIAFFYCTKNYSTWKSSSTFIGGIVFLFFLL